MAGARKDCGELDARFGRVFKDLTGGQAGFVQKRPKLPDVAPRSPRPRSPHAPPPSRAASAAWKPSSTDDSASLTAHQVMPAACQWRTA